MWSSIRIFLNIIFACISIEYDNIIIIIEKSVDVLVTRRHPN